MNNQGSYIIQGSLLALLIPITILIIEKIASIQPVKESASSPIGYEVPKSDKVGLASAGKLLFLAKCASCHNVFKDGTGPALAGFGERGLWADRKKLYEWIRNPSAFMDKDPYTKSLKTKFGSVMTAFPDLTDNEVDAIVEYINQSGTVRYLPIAK